MKLAAIVLLAALQAVVTGGSQHGSQVKGGRNSSPSGVRKAVKVPEYSWSATKQPSGYHWECPAKFYVYWPEVNFITDDTENFPICWPESAVRLLLKSK